jgi:hypothetical protein
MTNGERGQALLEILVAATFVLVPVLFLIVYLGKVGDLQHRAHEAARYAAWESISTTKSPSEISNEINKRFLYGLHKDVDSEKDLKSTNLDKDRVDPLYLYSEAGKYETALVESDSSFSSTSHRNSDPDSEIHQWRQATLGNGIVGFNLESDGMHSVAVNIPFINTSRLSLEDPIETYSKNAIYAQAWRKVTDSRLKNAIENSIFGEKAFDNAVFDSMANFAELIGLEEWGGFKPGYVEGDVVPCSRVLGGGNDRELACF